MYGLISSHVTLSVHNQHQMLIVQIKENSFTQKRQEAAETIKDVDYADDQVLLANIHT